MAVVIIADALYKIWFGFLFTRFFLNHFCQLLLNDYLFLLFSCIILLNNDLFLGLLRDFLLFFLYDNDFWLSISYRHSLFLCRSRLAAMMVSRCGILYYAIPRLMRGTRRDICACCVISDHNDIAASITTRRWVHLRRIR